MANLESWRLFDFLEQFPHSSREDNPCKVYLSADFLTVLRDQVTQSRRCGPPPYPCDLSMTPCEALHRGREVSHS
jgi:hypothetical protein